MLSLSVLKEHFSSSLGLHKRPELLPVYETEIINRQTQRCQPLS